MNALLSEMNAFIPIEHLFIWRSQTSTTKALGEEVDVDLLQAIGRGDEYCEFVVRTGRS